MKFIPKILILLVSLSISIFCFGQKSDTCKVDPKPLEIWDILKWNNIGTSSISNNAEWFAWRVGPAEDNCKIKVRNMKTDSIYEFDSGKNTKGKIEFSDDSKWLGFFTYPTKKEFQKLKSQKKSKKNKLLLVNLETGKEKEFQDVKTFSFSNENPDWLTMYKYPPDARKDKEWKGSDLILYHLSDSIYLSFGNVSGYSFNKSGHWLIMTIDTEKNNSNCLLLRNMKTGEIISLDSDEADYEKLKWTKDGDGLTLLKGEKDENYEEKLYSVLGFKNFGNKIPEKIIYNPKDDESFPEKMSISPNRSPFWKEDLSLFYFGIHEINLTEKAKEKREKEKLKAEEKADSLANCDSTLVVDKQKKKTDKTKEKDDEKTPDMVIWHWKDKRLQSQQWVEKSKDENYSYLSFYNTLENKFTRLANDTIKHIYPATIGDFCLGVDRDNYLLQNSLEGRSFSDLYMINLHTGKPKLILEKIRWFYDLSPDDSHLLYYDDGHFYTYDMQKKKSYNITKKMPVSFIDVEDDHNVKNPPIRPIGWTSDSKYILLSDGWDIWKIQIHGKKWTNLTVNGRNKKIRYQRPFKFDRDIEGIDFSEPVYFKMYGEYTKKQGIGKIDKGKPGITPVLWDDAAYSRLYKAKNKDSFIYSKEDYKTFADRYFVNETFTNSKKITNANPQQIDYKWCSDVRIIDYISEYGDSLQGLLYLPADYDENKTYPTIVYMYEKLSQNAYNYLTPRLAGIMNTSYYTSNGYAVFNPDIIYKVNDPGISSVKCIMAGVKAAISTGIVNKDKIGIQGHSWGGYQTSFIITQTNLFKAAVAGAPLTNMLSMYSSIYWNSGSGNMAIFESSQGRFTGGYWDNLEAYTRNSPVYYAQNVQTPFVILHNDKDGAVDWNQGIEYYNTLRRLEKPVVMLEYKGENHGLKILENRKDYTIRMKEFFDHYLMDKKSPDWWVKGIDYLDLDNHLKERAKLLKPNEKEDGQCDDKSK